METIFRKPIQEKTNFLSKIRKIGEGRKTDFLRLQYVENCGMIGSAGGDENAADRTVNG